ncbi:MAG: hypothetical protein ACP5P1_13855 [Acidimicrobiales bacterium]
MAEGHPAGRVVRVPRLVVIGADAARMSAASVARRMLGADRLEIVAFDRGHYTSYSACGTPYFVGRQVSDVGSLIARSPGQFAAMGIDAVGVFGVQTLDDGLELRADLEASPPRRAIAVDRGMATSAAGVWAAGDCAEKHHLVSGRPVAIALGTYANKEGQTAGVNIAGGDVTFPGVLGTAVSKICTLEVAAAGFEAVGVVTESTTRAGYYPGAKPIWVKLVAEAGPGRLLGAQIVGEEGAAKRIDVVAMALWNHMSVEEMINVDLSYAPPFSPLWDPILIAARKTTERLHDQRGTPTSPSPDAAGQAQGAIPDLSPRAGAHPRSEP